MRKVGLGYNAQIAVDAANHLIVAANLVDAPNDQQQLATMAEQAREALGQSDTDKLQVVADAGYYDRVSLAAADDANFETFVARRERDTDKKKAAFTKTNSSTMPEQTFTDVPMERYLDARLRRKNGGCMFFYMPIRRLAAIVHCARNAHFNPIGVRTVGQRRCAGAGRCAARRGP
jgi:hypothetical protein